MIKITCSCGNTIDKRGFYIRKELMAHSKDDKIYLVCSLCGEKISIKNIVYL
jgi:hypothetical protein